MDESKQLEVKHESEEKTFVQRIAETFTNLKGRFGEHIVSFIYVILSVSLFLLIWEILCLTNVLKEPQIFAPHKIFIRIWNLITTGEIFIYTFASFTRLLISFSLAAVIGIIFGLLMGWKDIIYDFFDPVITFFMPIPGIAWAPLIFLWVGFEPILSRWGLINQNNWWWDFSLANPILITIGFIAGVFPVIQNMSIAIKTIDKKLIWATQTMGADSKTIFLKVLIPNSYPYLFTGLKLGLARCWRTIIATEFMSAAAQGLGFFIFYSQSLETSKTLIDIYAGIFVLAVVFYLIEQLIKLIEKQTIVKWGMVQLEGEIIG
ncbi:MAG: ABC transporter permease subunit [Candidatus Heimdallarchaeota archaeon]|nr:ABC transporter permease subunit [Candidatus Heimdallarchaeota archaeon]